MENLKVLITVKTYPIPSAKYDELVCTAGVKPDGSFVRLYPVNFRDLDFKKQYRKYQWIEIDAEKHGRSDVRKESYRPDCDTMRIVGEPIATKRGDWSERARFALAKKSRSLEELWEQQKRDNTSLGVFKPKKVHDLVIKPATPDWKSSFKAELKQQRLWEERGRSLQPLRKVPFKFQYLFECDDSRCRKNHGIMIEDWEVGALYWKLRDKGANPAEAAAKVKAKFLDDLCGEDKDTYFFVGAMLSHLNAWLILGVFRPKIPTPTKPPPDEPMLF